MADTLDRLSRALGDRYEVERQLARGGMGVVYLARDLRHGRRVAIKVLPPELSAALGTERFLSEIRITASLEHPHALTLIDSGEADGLLYYVMPFVDGESLRDRLDRVGSLPLAEAVQIAQDVAGALDHAHAAGIVHRDVKPANILLSAGAAVVTDFGIALAVSQAGGERLTGTGAVLGTPSYMSPEQAAGEECGPASDVFALAAVVYEMLTGRPPFEGNTFQATLARVLTEDPPAATSLVPSLPRSVDEALSRGLAKDPARRFPSSGELADALAPEPARRLSPLGRTVLAGGTLAVVAFLGVGGAHFYRQVADERWVRNVAIPELGRLLDEGRLVEAHDLAMSAQARSPDDAVLEELLHTSSTELWITSRPSGANVWYQAFDDPDGPWQPLGTTPVQGGLAPKAHIRVRLKRDGYRTLELGFMALWAELHADLVPEVPELDDMVWIPTGVVSRSGSPVAVDSFLIDRTEVTNAAFQAFVDAGGYASPDPWPVDVLREAESLSWEEARTFFEDATGRPGPSRWQLSRHPEGEGELPVGGVSWYEAVAYCRSVGKDLPTFHHWQRAAALDLGVTDDVLDLSNFDGQGPEPVASNGAVGLYGTHDLAGNVKEWVWNASRGLRRTAGGAWNEPEYVFLDHSASDPMTREATHGFRCARYRTPPGDSLLGPVDLPLFDFHDMRAVDDETFATYASFYAYDSGPLDARVEAVDTTEPWRKETVSFAAAYGNERVSAYLFLPADAQPPYQAVVAFPGSAAFQMESSEYLADFYLMRFIPLSGRALVYPILKGSYERNFERRPGRVARRERTVWMTQDVRRTVDYLLERPDIDGDRIGYFGLSLGAEIVVPFAVEDRFAALALVGGAFDAAWIEAVLPEAAPWNFAPRVRTPLILVNGRRDFMHPYETGQVPFFDALGTPDADKRFVLDQESGHVPDWNVAVREILDFYDEYLGPVERREPGAGR